VRLLFCLTSGVRGGAGIPPVRSPVECASGAREPVSSGGEFQKRAQGEFPLPRGIAGKGKKATAFAGEDAGERGRCPAGGGGNSRSPAAWPGKAKKAAAFAGDCAYQQQYPPSMIKSAPVM
jgi:hypothetical protein